MMDKERWHKKWMPQLGLQADVRLDLGLTNFGTEYAENTTLHGLRYVGDTKLHLTERFYWIIAFIFGILGAVYFISSMYARWRDSPMIISLSPTPISLSDIPFPAVTICNMNRAMKNIAEPIKLSSNEEMNDTVQFEKNMLQAFCRDTAYYFPNVNDTKVSGNWSMVKNFLIKVSQPCEDMLVDCKWFGGYLSCTREFRAEVTGDGMCCSFNKVRQRNIYKNPDQPLGLVKTQADTDYYDIQWTPERGFSMEPDQYYAKPWRMSGPGASVGLTLVLDAKVEEYFCSDTTSAGFKVMLHSPLDYAQRMSDIGHFISAGFETRVEIKPEITTAAPNLVNVPLEKRQCYFISERELGFFKTYTQKNCETECYSNVTLRMCSCVPFYLPRGENTRICGSADEECVGLTKGIMRNMNLEKIQDQLHIMVLVGEAVNCTCIPTCVSIDYAKEMSSGRLHTIADASVVGYPMEYYKENMAVVHFYFAERSFIGVEQEEIFGFTEFISNTGGLLGLFMGFSIMSIIELVYFLSLRIFFKWFRNKKDIIQPVFMKNNNQIGLWNP